MRLTTFGQYVQNFNELDESWIDPNLKHDIRTLVAANQGWDYSENSLANVSAEDGKRICEFLKEQATQREHEDAPHLDDVLATIEAGYFQVENPYNMHDIHELSGDVRTITPHPLIHNIWSSVELPYTAQVARRALVISTILYNGLLLNENNTIPLTYKQDILEKNQWEQLEPNLHEPFPYDVAQHARVDIGTAYELHQCRRHLETAGPLHNTAVTAVKLVRDLFRLYQERVSKPANEMIHTHEVAWEKLFPTDT